MTHLRQRLLGLAAVTAILAVVAGVPALLVALDAIPSTRSFTWAALTSPDDGTLAMAVIGVVAWAAWLVFTASLVLEAAARLRDHRAPRIPGLGLPQVAAYRLVATATLLFVAVPTIAQMPGPRAEAHNTRPAALAQHPSPAGDQPARTPPTTPPTTPPATTDHHQATVPYRVKRGDSLWKIAEERLGDGTRYTEIVALNAGILNGRPDFITPGLDLRIPDEQPRQPEEHAETYAVEPGDTLSEIALNELGNASAYPMIFKASTDTLQPDRAHLIDPDLIRPGWTLTIPDADGAAGRPGKPQHEQHTKQPPPPLDSNQPVSPRTRPPADPEPRVLDSTGQEASTTPPDDSDDAGAELPGWVIPGLTGAGALLAGSLLLVLRSHRKTQRRYRKPGHIIAPPPPELEPVEKTAHLAGTETEPYVQDLDATLRILAGAVDHLPRLHTAEIADGRVILHLAQPAALPKPWQGSGVTWSARLKTSDDPDALAPYPLLVAVGQDADGHPWLLNLEELKSITVVGDTERTAAFGRFVAAELALNRWSALVAVDTLGICAELEELDPIRLHHHPGPDESALERLASDLDRANQIPDAEPDQFHALMTTGDHAEAGRRIAKIIASHPGRAGAAVIVMSGEPAPGDTVLELTDGGRLRAPSIGLNLAAAGLTADEAAACAAIVDVTRGAANSPIPVTDEATTGPASLADAAGALRAEFTTPRPDGPAGEESLLPRASDDYESAAPTTAQDIAALAPLNAPDARRRVAEADPTLDGDLARWFDADARVPKLTLLGPVNARAFGGGIAVSKRKPFYVELLAYLLLHPHGVSSHQVGDAMGIRPERAHTDLSVLRTWLGDDPRTGTRYLPSARAASGSGASTYQVHGVLSDLDLFRRLRARGQSKGEHGISDLVAALKLVSGEPFSNLRPAGWSWLLEGERIDHIMTCAVVDAGHIVTTHALAIGDLDLARMSAETAYRAAPDDDVSSLDLIEVARATGHAELADRQLVERVLNRSDDDLGPIDLPERTARLVHQQVHDRTPRPADR